MPTTSQRQWPDDVPLDVGINGLEIGGPDGNASFDVDNGPSKKRPRYSAVSDWFTFSIYCTVTQWGRLNKFYLTDLANGSLTFTRRDPITQEMRDWQFKSRPSASGLSGNMVIGSVQICSVP